MEIVSTNFNYLKYKLEFCKQEEWFKWLKIFEEAIVNTSVQFQMYSQPSMAVLISSSAAFICSNPYSLNLVPSVPLQIDFVEPIPTSYTNNAKSCISYPLYFDTSSSVYGKHKTWIHTASSLHTDPFSSTFAVYTSYSLDILPANFTTVGTSIDSEFTIDISDEISANSSLCLGSGLEGTSRTLYDVALTIFEPERVNMLNVFNTYTLDELSSYNLFELSYSKF